MLKILGIVFILCGSTGFCHNLDIQLKKHLKNLLEWQEIFLSMELYKRTLRLPYGQLLRKSARGRRGICQEILTGIAIEMEKNCEADVSILCEQILEEKGQELLLSQEEKEILSGFFLALASDTTDTKGCEIYFLQLEKQITQQMEEKKEKQRLYRAMGVLSGLFFVILLL